MKKAERNAYKAVLKRDNHQCIICNSNNIHIHHVVYRSLGGATIKENMVCLCKEHHDHYHSIGKDGTTELINYLSHYYGVIDKQDLKKKGRYSNWAIPN